MNTNFKTHILVTTLATSLLVLAGCTTQTATNTNAVSNTNATVNTNTTTNDNTNDIVVSDNTSADQRNEVDTSDWLTYTNEEYGFSFRYPKSWTVTGIDKWGCVELASSELTTYNEEWAKQNKEAAQIGTDAVKTYDINICYKENSSGLSLDSWIEENVDSTWIISKQYIQFDGINSIEIVTNALGVWRQTYIPDGQSIVRVSRLKEPIAIDSDLVEEVISTIKLVQ